MRAAQTRYGCFGKAHPVCSWPHLWAPTRTAGLQDRKGAVACIKLAVDHFNVTEDLMVIGGDTLFLDDFSLADVQSCHSANVARVPGASTVLSYDTDDVGTTKCGILEVGDDQRVTAFLEKPGPEATASRLACPCFYILGGAALPLLGSFLDENSDKPLAARDAPGNFIRYLIAKAPVFAKKISGRFDVGGLASYIECDKHFQ
eukprot:m.22152 g.22152  ORF g.22152 m.22152 type:complete len:203 (+) comp3984_c0_seq1:3-611(+)